jgi:8-oxo-dGTP diphosphatase
MTRKLVDVAAGVLLRPDGCYLLGQRAQDTR